MWNRFRNLAFITGLPLALFAAVLQSNVVLAVAVNNQLFQYQSTISSDASGPLNLKAELDYNDSRTDAPIVVVMHGLNGGMADVEGDAQHLRDKGFFVVDVAMRGRDGSGGMVDCGGLEIYDIYDAVQAVKAQYGAYVNPTNVSIEGYSGGGGNVMSALTKFPDYFRVGASFFGMSDYGYSKTNGWYYNPGQYASWMAGVIGDPTTGNSAIVDKYMARDSALASKNNPYSRNSPVRQR